MQHHPKQKLFASRAQVLVLAAIVPFIWSCSSLEPARMTPEAVAVSTMKVGGSVRVMDVTGGKKPQFGGPMMIDNDQYKKALTLALQQSGLFNRVGSDAGDMDLYATIRSQDQKVSRGLQYTATMVVNYKFMDSAGNVVWSSSYNSEFSSTAFSGAARTIGAREGSVRENLTALVRGIQEQWPRT